jgi:hypothetical protein
MAVTGGTTVDSMFVATEAGVCRRLIRYWRFEEAVSTSVDSMSVVAKAEVRFFATCFFLKDFFATIIIQL